MSDAAGLLPAWEVSARERIRDTLARYTWSGDSFRLDEMASAFCADGELEIRGQTPLRGRSAIIDFLSGGVAGTSDEDRRAARRDVTGAPRIVRHHVTNVRFLEVTPELARVVSYFTVFTEIGLDHHGRYRDRLVPVGDEWLLQHRFVSTDWSDPRSTMARR